METKQTNLQKIVARAADYLAEHIESAIDSGAKMISSGGGVLVDGVFIMHTFKKGKDGCIILHIKSEAVAKALQPTEKELTERAEKLRAELNEIENKLQK